MNTLNLGSDEIPATKKKSNTRNLKIALGLAAVILVPTIGSTLAGTISVSGDRVEFGQGLAQAAACDSDGITLTPATSFSNTAGAGSFALGTIAISGINDDCAGKTFKITAYSDDSALVALSGGSPAIVGFSYAITPSIDAVDAFCTPTEVPAGTYDLACGYAEGGDNATVTITVQAGIDPEDIFKFTVETA